MRPRLLDLFSGAGGAAMGYHRAGFDCNVPRRFMERGFADLAEDGLAARVAELETKMATLQRQAGQKPGDDDGEGSRRAS